MLPMTRPITLLRFESVAYFCSEIKHMPGIERFTRLNNHNQYKNVIWFSFEHANFTNSTYRIHWLTPRLCLGDFWRPVTKRTSLRTQTLKRNSINMLVNCYTYMRWKSTYVDIRMHVRININNKRKTCVVDT